MIKIIAGENVIEGIHKRHTIKNGEFILELALPNSAFVIEVKFPKVPDGLESTLTRLNKAQISNCEINMNTIGPDGKPRPTITLLKK